MIYLLLVSLVWAISFGLIGNHLTDLPAGFVAFFRILLSFLVFLPFARRIPWKSAAKLMALGAVQFGLMYLTYIAAFGYLPSYQVALFTVLTPFYVVLINDFHDRKWHLRHLCAAALVILGCGIIQWKGGDYGETKWTGFLILQISNLCFALGQWIYARMKLPSTSNRDRSGRSTFAYLYLGACLLLLPISVNDFLPSLKSLTAVQWQILLYLGVVASGICFFLWNYGARRVSPVQLAVMNNLKIPLAAVSSLTLFGEKADWPTLVPGLGLVVLALLLAGKTTKHV